MSNELLTATDVAAQLKISLRTLEAWRRRRVLPFIRLGPKSVRYEPKVVEDFLAKRTVASR